MNLRQKITVLLLLTITLSGIIILLNQAKAADGSASPSPQITTPSAKNLDAVKVKTETVSKNHKSTIDLVGTIKANDQIKVFATATGQVVNILVSEGQTVKKGDPLFVIGGINGTKPIALIQLEIAQKNYDAAKKGLEITEKSNTAALKAAQLQLLSAQHAAEGSNIDLQVFDRNISAINTGLNYMDSSLDATRRNSDLALENAQIGIDALKTSINKLEKQKADLEKFIEEHGTTIASQPSPAQNTTGQGQPQGLNASQPAGQGAQDLSSGMGQLPSGQQNATNTTDLASQLATLNQTIEDLYTKLESAKIGYKQLEQARTLSQNTIMGQISQSQAQSDVLFLNKQSAATKLGLNDGGSDAVKLAQAGLDAARIKNEAALIQSQTQLALASSNLEMARIQADALTVRSPINGVVGEIGVNLGDLVSQQSLLTQISGQNNYELRTALDADSADLVKVGSIAEVLIGGKYIKLPVKSVSAYADPATKLVALSIALPKVNFRANAPLKIRLSLEHGNDALETGTFFIPLDALIIGTEEQYVFIVKNGKAVRRVVETGEVRGDQVAITKGLEEGDLVITEGAKTVLENQAVNPT